jgi:ABC-2 type transport system permease protein
MMIFSIAMRDIRSMFQSPLGWAFLAIVQVILAYFFLLYLDAFAKVQPQLAGLANAPGITNIVVAPLFVTAATLLLIIVPLISMRAISEERRNKTLSLLFSAPVSMTEIVLGKYLGILGFLGIELALVTLMPLTLGFGANLDYAMLFAGLLGLSLVLASFAAVGLYMSILTAHPSVAAISSFGILILLWILDFASTTGESGELFNYVSMLFHYQSMLQGIVNSSDILYYLLFIVLFLVLSIRRLDAERLQH